MALHVLEQDDQAFADVLRVQAVRLNVLAAVSDLASDPLDRRNADAMRAALQGADDARHLLAQMRVQSRCTPRLTVLRGGNEETE